MPRVHSPNVLQLRETNYQVADFSVRPFVPERHKLLSLGCDVRLWITLDARHSPRLSQAYWNRSGGRRAFILESYLAKLACPPRVEMLELKWIRRRSTTWN
jgi:hypothetical protein